MNLPKYALSSNDDFHFYKFVSTGPKGDIVKGIQFSLIELSDTPLYNLALGDIDPDTGELDDTIRSNNGDRDIIFATIGCAVMDFCSRHKDLYILAEGNTPAKQMLYRIQVATHLESVNEYFEVFGLFEDNWEVFQKNRKYESLLVSQK